MARISISASCELHLVLPDLHVTFEMALVARLLTCAIWRQLRRLRSRRRCVYQDKWLWFCEVLWFKTSICHSTTHTTHVKAYNACQSIEGTEHTDLSCCMTSSDDWVWMNARGLSIQFGMSALIVHTLNLHGQQLCTSQINRPTNWPCIARFWKETYCIQIVPRATGGLLRHEMTHVTSCAHLIAELACVHACMCMKALCKRRCAFMCIQVLAMILVYTHARSRSRGIYFSNACTHMRAPVRVHVERPPEIAHA
jgi:hypothetical protein